MAIWQPSIVAQTLSASVMIHASRQFVGLDNFTALFHDSYYLDSFWTTMKFSALVTVSGLVASLFFAAALGW